MKKLFVITFVSFVFCLPVLGQSDRQIETELVRHIKNIEKWSEYFNRGYDPARSKKLENEARIFKTKLLKYTKRLSTLKYEFKELGEHIFIATSEDGKFRIYSWDTESGGSMHFYETVFQYQGENGKVFSEGDSLDEGDPGGFYSEIFELDIDKRKIYLARFHAILSTSLSFQSIFLYELKNNSLKGDINLFETDEGLSDSVSVEYDFFSVVDRKERPIKLILYDKATRSIKVPVVVEDKTYAYGKVTDKFVVYKFDGKHFVKTK